MPRLAIDYKKACIYEIVCKDVSITQRYVGSTTNLIKRRYEHKSDCNNEKRKNYNYYVYQFIRENGSFDNWDVVLIEKVIDCKDKENLHKRERFYIEEKKAELNKQIPLRTVKEWREDNKEYHKEWCEDNKNKIDEYYANNRDKIAEKRKIYYEENRDKYKEYYTNNVDKYKEYYTNNVDKLKEKQRIYRANKKNEINEKQRIYYENKKNEINEKQRIYRVNNKNEINEKQRIYRANKKNLN
jgi:hypothetical protein